MTFVLGSLNKKLGECAINSSTKYCEQIIRIPMMCSMTTEAPMLHRFLMLKIPQIRIVALSLNFLFPVIP